MRKRVHLYLTWLLLVGIPSSSLASHDLSGLKALAITLHVGLALPIPINAVNTHWPNNPMNREARGISIACGVAGILFGGLQTALGATALRDRDNTAGGLLLAGGAANVGYGIATLFRRPQPKFDIAPVINPVDGNVGAQMTIPLP
ncbi:MAG: hypothetical protein HY696_00075 [Deltaproteobacteria bacterium]|nr:hypothetical protein [Deltaproteobacteria bacterium]